VFSHVPQRVNIGCGGSVRLGAIFRKSVVRDGAFKKTYDVKNEFINLRELISYFFRKL
jgi:hypothetical protein